MNPLYGLLTIVVLGAIAVAASVSLFRMTRLHEKKSRDMQEQLQEKEELLRRLTKDLQEAEESKNRQRVSFERFHRDYVEKLKKEIQEREEQIAQLHEQLKTLKDKTRAQDISRNIQLLVSERDALKQQLQSDQSSAPEVHRPVDWDMLYALKDQIARLKVDNSRLRSLSGQYKNRYQDMLEFGTRIKMENRNLQDQIQRLLEKMGGPLRSKRPGS